MDLYLHIGTEKTGTSSVQNFFGANREQLAHMGILYPESPGKKNHTGLTAAAQDLSEIGALRKTVGLGTRGEIESFRQKLIANLEAEYRRRDFKAVVMSGEHCSSRLLHDEEVQWLRDILSPHFDKIKIIVYLRRQDDFLLSTYSTAVKSGGTVPLGIPPQRIIETRYDYWRLLSRWARMFGRDAVIARKFERAKLVNGDIVDDFLSIAGIEAEPKFERRVDANESLDAETLEFLRLFNMRVPRFVDNRVNPAKANILLFLNKISSGPLITLPDEQLAEFIGMFEESNRKVAAEYFGGARDAPGDPLFEPRSDKRDRVPPVALTVERAVEIGAHLWLEKQAQFERVKAREKSRAGSGKVGRRKKGHVNPERNMTELS